MQHIRNTISSCLTSCGPIADTLPPMLHLPVSPDDTLHFYRYLHTHILIENKQFLLLIDMLIQDDRSQSTGTLL